MCLSRTAFAFVLAVSSSVGFTDAKPIRVRILDRQDNAIGNASVTARGPGGTFLAQATSAATGEAKLVGLPAKGPFRIDVQSPGFAPSVVIVDTPADREIAVFLALGWSEPIGLTTEPFHLETIRSPIPETLVVTLFGGSLRPLSPQLHMPVRKPLWRRFQR